MLKFVLAAMLSVASFSFSANAAGKGKEEGFKLIQVTELDQSMAPGKPQVFVFDANNKTTREKDGMIPGAKLLDSVAHYDAATTLPADKSASLVFYCANTKCTASHEAAKVAVKAGYTNVAVLAPGIEGWKKAGKKTDKVGM